MGELTFIIPVRHQNSIADWDSVRDRLALTLRSIAAQDDPHWSCFIVANRGAVLPPTDDDRIRVCRVDLPLPTLPDRKTDRQGYERAVRTDKGWRILHGLMLARPRGHVMTVDYDDLVSRRLAGLAVENPTAPGWILQTGYLYDELSIVYHTPDFHSICGTSLIVRADLLGVPENIAAVDEDWLRRTLGSQLFLPGDLGARGITLSPLAFPGAIYRVGHAEATSRSRAMLSMAFRSRPTPTRDPLRLLRIIGGFRRLSRAMRDEFFGREQHAM